MARNLAMATRGKQVPKEHIIYLAGMVDADGSVNISKNAPSTVKNAAMKNPRYVLHLSVVNTHKGLMEWLVANFGGIYRARKNAKPTHHKPTHLWRFDNGKALPLLEMLEPYLIVKKERAQLGIEFLRGWKTSHGMGIPTDPAEIARRELCWQRMSAMNKLGPVQPQRLSPLAPSHEG